MSYFLRFNKTNSTVMLLNDFYELLYQDIVDEQLVSVVKLYPEHAIFEGHFPDHPVVPGVVQLQIIKELLSLHLERTVRLSGLKACKFLKVINPLEISELRFEIAINEQDVIHINVVGKAHGEVFLKAHLDYVETPL
jgi:3-hydroxyacyl-[acyl-carrier-protein] dehydratase